MRKLLDILLPIGQLERTEVKLRHDDEKHPKVLHLLGKILRPLSDRQLLFLILRNNELKEDLVTFFTKLILLLLTHGKCLVRRRGANFKMKLILKGIHL